MPGRKSNTGDYRYGFNGKEDDKSWGTQNIQDYGFRLYNPNIGKFLSVDPLAKSYPYYTPYQFAGNMPIWAIDLDGLEPVVKNGKLVGFNVQSPGAKGKNGSYAVGEKGMGYSQIAAIVNDPFVQNSYGYTLVSKVTWKDISMDLHNHTLYTLPAFIEIPGNQEDANAEAYRKMNMNPGSGSKKPDYINLDFVKNKEETPFTPPPRWQRPGVRNRAGNKPFATNKMVSIGVSAFSGLGGSFAFGFVWDEDGDFGIFTTVGVGVGMGGGGGISITDIKRAPGNNVPLTTWDFKGADVEREIGVGPVSASYGENAHETGFETGDIYTTSSGGLQPSIKVEGSVQTKQTKIWFSTEPEP
jgi:RHS repeat-associated protein